MSVIIEARREILDKHWTYFDVLFLALSYLPDGVNRLTADSGKWNQIVAEPKEQFRKRNPELLARIHFRHRPPLPPHSDQLDNFFMGAGISDVLEYSPHDNTFYISRETKRRLQERIEPKLLGHEESIHEISKALHELVIEGGE